MPTRPWLTTWRVSLQCVSIAALTQEHKLPMMLLLVQLHHAAYALAAPHQSRGAAFAHAKVDTNRRRQGR